MGTLLFTARSFPTHRSGSPTPQGTGEAREYAELSSAARTGGLCRPDGRRPRPHRLRRQRQCRHRRQGRQERQRLGQDVHGEDRHLGQGRFDERVHQRDRSEGQRRQADGREDDGVGERCRRTGGDNRGRRQLAARRRSWSVGRSTRSRPPRRTPSGRTAAENSTFTTVSPSNSFIGNFTPEDGSTVGVGMPVSFNFDKAITNKAAVQKAHHRHLQQRPAGRRPLVRRQPPRLPPRELLEGRLQGHPQARPGRRRGRERRLRRAAEDGHLHDRPLPGLHRRRQDARP